MIKRAEDLEQSGWLRSFGRGALPIAMGDSLGIATGIATGNPLLGQAVSLATILGPGGSLTDKLIAPKPGDDSSTYAALRGLGTITGISAGTVAGAIPLIDEVSRGIKPKFTAPHAAGMLGGAGLGGLLAYSLLSNYLRGEPSAKWDKTSSLQAQFNNDVATRASEKLAMLVTK